MKTGKSVVERNGGEYFIPARSEEFVVKDYVTENESRGETKIGIEGYDVNFREWFLCKIEEPIRKTVVASMSLIHDYTDNELIGHLGGVVKAEMTLSEMFAIMKYIQTYDRQDWLQYAGWAPHYFYVKDTRGKLRVISVSYWYKRGWFISAEALNKEKKEETDYRKRLYTAVFFRKS